MEIFAPALLAILFIVFGLSQRGRSPGRCSGCPGGGECGGRDDGAAECARGPDPAADDPAV